MRNFPFRRVVLAAALTLSLPNIAWANGINAQALELASQKNTARRKESWMRSSRNFLVILMYNWLSEI